MGAINKEGIDFLNDLKRRITQGTDDHRESAFLYRRLCVNPTLQRGRCFGYLCLHNTQDEM